MKTIVICVIASLILVACSCDTPKKKYTCDKDCQEWVNTCAKTNAMWVCTDTARELGISKEVENENLSTSEHWN